MPAAAPEPLVPPSRPVAAAAMFREEIEGRANEIEALRSLPQDLVQRLDAAGLYRLCNPPAFGGAGETPRAYAEVVERLAQADASVGWCVFIGVTSAFAMACANTDAVRGLLCEPGCVTAGVFAPTARAQPVTEEGRPGYRVSGRWSWGSGSQNARWVSGGALLADADGAILKDAAGRPRHINLILAAQDIAFLDNWQVMGLQGTGSTDFEVHGVFVPEARAYGVAGGRFGDPVDDPIFRFPHFGMLGVGIGAAALGAARAALEDLLVLARSKIPQGGSTRLAEKSATARDVARADAAIRSGRAYLFEAIDAAWAAALADQVSLEHRRDLRQATTHAVQAAKTAVDLVHELAGGASVFRNCPIQRRFRDIHVMTQHMMVSQATYELFGRLQLELPTDVDRL